MTEDAAAHGERCRYRRGRRCGRRRADRRPDRQRRRRRGDRRAFGRGGGWRWRLHHRPAGAAPAGSGQVRPAAPAERAAASPTGERAAEAAATAAALRHRSDPVPFKAVNVEAGEPADGLRPGEVALPFDPANEPDAGVAFIGRIRSPWPKGGECPKNPREAREQTPHVMIELDRAIGPGSTGCARRPSRAALLDGRGAARRDRAATPPPRPPCRGVRPALARAAESGRDGGREPCGRSMPPPAR